MYELHI